MAKFSTLRTSSMLILSCIKGLSCKISSFNKAHAISDHSLDDIEAAPGAPASPPSEEELPLRVTSTNARPHSGFKRFGVGIQSFFTKPHDRSKPSSFVEMKASDSPNSQTQLASPPVALHYSPSPTNRSSSSLPSEELPLRVTSTNAHPHSGFKRLVVGIQSFFTKPRHPNHDHDFSKPPPPSSPVSPPISECFIHIEASGDRNSLPDSPNNAQRYSAFKRFCIGIQSVLTKPRDDHDRSIPPLSDASGALIHGGRNSLPGSPNSETQLASSPVAYYHYSPSPTSRSSTSWSPSASIDYPYGSTSTGRSWSTSSPSEALPLHNVRNNNNNNNADEVPLRSVTTTNAQPYSGFGRLRVGTQSFFTGRSWTSSTSQALPVRNNNNNNNNNNNADQTSPSTATQPKLSNPIAQAFRDLELGKASLGLVIPLGAWILAVVIYTKDDSLIHLYIPVICVAPAALLYGIGLRNMFPRVANAAEQFGVVALCIAFYWPVVSLLPRKLVCLPLAGFLAIGLLSIWSCIRIRYIAQNLVN